MEAPKDLHEDPRPAGEAEFKAVIHPVQGTRLHVITAGAMSDALTPAELIRALLRAPVDLLWNGGIGTYVKAGVESDAMVGDRANDPLRVDATEVRARVIGEGANLGMTQRARIEVAQLGGRLNTDFIDNSAGVDCSDHEVNIKILLGDAEAAGDLTRKQRDELLREMTDEVGELVLSDNYLQTQTITEPAVVDQVCVSIQRQVIGHHAGTRLEQARDTVALHAGDAGILAFPEITVVHQDGIGPGGNGLLDQFQAGRHAADQRADLCPALHLQTVRRIVAILVYRQQLIGVFMQFLQGCHAFVSCVYPSFNNVLNVATGYLTHDTSQIDFLPAAGHHRRPGEHAARDGPRG